jgi:hypothetical protein
MNDADFKPCPFCKEQIRKEAVKCRFCGEWLEQPVYPASSQPVTQEPSQTPPPAVTEKTPTAAEAPPQAAIENKSTVSATVDREIAPEKVEKVPVNGTQAEPMKLSQEDFALGEQVFRDLADVLNICPLEETWRLEFLARRTSATPIAASLLEELWLALDASGIKPLPKRVEKSEESPGLKIFDVAPKKLYLIGTGFLLLGVIIVIWMFRDVDFSRGDPDKVSSLMAAMILKPILGAAALAWVVHSFFGNRKGYRFLVFAITWAVVMTSWSLKFREGLNASRLKSQVEHNQVTTLASNFLEYAQNENGGSLHKIKTSLSADTDSFMIPIMEFTKNLFEAVGKRDQAMAGLREKDIYDLTLLTNRFEMQSEIKKRQKGHEIVETFKADVNVIIENARRRYDQIAAPEKDKLSSLRGFEQSIKDKAPERESSYRLLTAQQKNECDYLQFMVDSFKDYQIKDGKILFFTDEVLAGYNRHLKIIENTEKEMVDFRTAMLNSTKQTAEQLLK